MITCYLRYVIHPYKIAEVEEYARMVLPLAAKYRGTRHGYFLPHEGPNNLAVKLFSLASLADYERYRIAVKQDEIALAAWHHQAETHCILSFDRTSCAPCLSEC